MSTTQTLVAGTATGDVLVLEHALSFWGGVHEETGAIIDRHHPQHGASVAGKVLVMPSGRGSSSSSSVLAEVIRVGASPVAIVLSERDPIVALGAMVGEALYARTVPVVVLSPEDYARICSWRRATVSASDGEVTVREALEAQP